MKTEEKIYQALHRHTGVRLSYDELVSLVCVDDAIETRITNALAGVDLGFADLDRYQRPLAAQKKHLRKMNQGVK